jgi:murein DD-endopeptidase MepM/ murein hydrolase activator NlpD
VHYKSRLRQYALQRWLLRLLLLSVALVLLGAALVTLDKRSLPGLKVGGVPLPQTTDPLPVLRAQAEAWGKTQVRLVTKPHLTKVTRAELGGKLDADAMAARVKLVGHSGNPLSDLWTWQDAKRHGMELSWLPHIDRAQLGRYVRAVRNVVERPPVAGTVDQEGVTLAGVPGVTLDVVLTADVLEQLLRSGQLEANVDLREVPAPQIEIGSPDGIDEEHTEAEEPEPRASRGNKPGPVQAKLTAAMQERMRALAPHSWLPPQGCEAMDPPYERFCQGPRRAAAPHGTAAELAEKLDLGSLQTVGRLLSAPPKAAWVAAAGGPVPTQMLLKPVPSGAGTIWRQFGFVRRPPFEKLIHRGWDIGALRGTPLLAVNPGIVAYSDNRVRGYGNLLVIVHPDASVTFSAHCRAIYVFAGQRVERGQIVGEVGDTGLARGSHVHWEYHVQGGAVDPKEMWSKEP